MIGDQAASNLFIEATVRMATPLTLAAVGECVSERAGVINIGLEGCIISGAFAATVAAGGYGVASGYVVGALAGMAIAALVVVFVVALRADQIITGTAITLFALGLTGTLNHTVYGVTGVGLTTPTQAPYLVPMLSALPLVGHGLFGQPPIAYLMYLAIPLTTWWLFRTQHGLALRAVGERPEAAIAAGIRPRRLQAVGVLFAGSMAGLAGATLVLAQAGTFVEGMSAGRGFIAIAIVVLGRWHPVRVAGAALLFGAANAVQYLFQAKGWSGVPYQLFLAAPYVLTLFVLAGASRRAAAPASLGRRELTNRE